MAHDPEKRNNRQLQMRGVKSTCIVLLALSFSAMSFDKHQVGAWSVDGQYVQGVIYRFDERCHLMTVGAEWAGKTLYPLPNSELPRIDVKARTFFDGKNLALYLLSADLDGCQALPWGETLEAKAMLAGDIFGNEVELFSITDGDTSSIKAEIGSTGDNFVCFSSDLLTRGSSIAGAVVRLKGKAIGIAIGWGRCEGGGLGFVAKRIDIIENELNVVSLAPLQGTYSNNEPFRNGFYTGPLVQGLPNGSPGVFIFEIGQEEVFSLTGDEWKISGRFKEGNPDGQVILQGPISEDGGAQRCSLQYSEGSLISGQCDVYFSSYLSPLGVDPRLLVSWRIQTLKQAAEDGLVECDDPPNCTKFSGGEMAIMGRYTGDIKRGQKSFFEPSSRLVGNQLTEEYLVLHGSGEFLDEGLATNCWLGCDHVNAEGTNRYEGGWIDGSLTGAGSITMNYGAKLTGDFKLNYLMNGYAEDATANMVGMAYNMGSDVYSGPILNGYEHGPNGIKTNEYNHSRFMGEFKEGSPWNATGSWTQDGVRYRCKWADGNVTC